MITHKDVPEMLELAQAQTAEQMCQRDAYVVCALKSMAEHCANNSGHGEPSKALIAALTTMFDVGFAHGVKTAQVRRN